MSYAFIQETKFFPLPPLKKEQNDLKMAKHITCVTFFKAKIFF